jgi:Protein of unknown function (DUF3303)
MKFMMTFSWKPDTKEKERDEGIKRFRKTGGQPPAGVKLLGRWIRADFSGGFDLVESDNPQPLFEFAFMWSDLMDMTILPVLEDQEFSDALKHLGK